MIADAQPTPFDLRFRLLGFPVRVAPWFWLSMAFIGGDWVLRLGLKYELLWLLCGFVSILVHELGHAVLIRRFGSPSDITLLGFGGQASWPVPPRARWKRIVVSLAGPAAGLALAGIVWLSDRATPWAETSLTAALGYEFLVTVNIFWSLINLLPIWPLDGGKVCRELCGAARLRNPDVTAFAISTLTAGGIVVVGVLALAKSLPPEVRAWLPFVPSPLMTLFVGLFAVESYQLWQQAQRTRPWDYEPDDDDTPPWKRR